MTNDDRPKDEEVRADDTRDDGVQADEIHAESHDATDSPNNDLRNLLALEPLVEDPITFAGFLSELKGNEDRVCTAPEVILNSIVELGVEDPEEEPDTERRRFLRVLKKVGIPSFQAFKHVCGSQLFAYRFFKRFLEPASTGGAQLRKMLVIEGGPGAGKDYFKDGIERALDMVAKVYAVEGCPDNENPINLLKLLPEDILKQVATAAGFEEGELEKLMQTAGNPCQHCYTKVMGSIDEPNEKPNLGDVKIVRISLSSRSTGVFEWKPGQDCSLIAALRRANRGFISMPDAFLKREVAPGHTDERLILLDATQYRRLPGECGGKDATVAASPLDVLMFATTNKNSLVQFLKTLPDPDAFTGRSEQLKLPYNLVLVEEVRAYLSEMQRYDEVANFGPLALRMIGTLAVLSRYAVPEKDSGFIHPIERMRLLQGEEIKVHLLPPARWKEVWDTQSSGSSGAGDYGGGFGSGIESSRRSSSSSAGSNLATAKQVPTGVRITPELMWSLIGSDEGLVGLDMRFMMSLLSRINQTGLAAAKKKGNKGDSSVTALEAIMLLRSAIYIALRDDNNLTDAQKEVLTRCQYWLGGIPEVGETWTKEAASKPGLIEAEYRRLLKQQILQAFSPDYESRAQEMFEDYVLHAVAFAKGEDHVKHLRHGKIPMDEDILDDLDRYRLGKGSSGFIADDDKGFRKALTTLLSEKKDEFLGKACADKDLEPDCDEARQLRIKLAKTWQPNWLTLPELANAIRAKLDNEIGELVQKLLKTEVVSDLDKDERERMEGALTALTELGYSEKARATILEYAKRVEVWKHQS